MVHPVGLNDDGSPTEKEFTADNVMKVHLRFWPNQKRSYALDSVSIRKVASFVDINQLNDKPVDTDSKE